MSIRELLNTYRAKVKEYEGMCLLPASKRPMELRHLYGALGQLRVVVHDLEKLLAAEAGTISITFGLEPEPTVYENCPHLSVEECVRDCIERIVWDGDGSKPAVVAEAVRWLHVNTFLPGSPGTEQPMVSNPERTGKIKVDLYAISSDVPLDTVISKERMEESVCLWRSAGTPVRYDHEEQEWVELETGCSVAEEFVTEDRLHVYAEPINMNLDQIKEAVIKHLNEAIWEDIGESPEDHELFEAGCRLMRKEIRECKSVEELAQYLEGEVLACSYSECLVFIIDSIIYTSESKETP